MSHIAGPSTIAPSDSSRTIVLYDSQPREEDLDRVDTQDGDLSTERVLHLLGGRRTQPRVAWTDDVIDNEGMGKKKSKICCIYHKQRRYDDSSSESDSSDSGQDSDSDSDSGRAQPGGRLGRFRNHSHRSHRHPHPHDQNGGSNGTGDGHVMRDGDGVSTTVQELSDDQYKPNAYEQQPGRRKGKGKEVGRDEAAFNPGD